MDEPNPRVSPIEAAAEVTDDRVTDVFAMLGNETRLAILLALAEATDPESEGTWNPTGDDALTFSSLRDRVGATDPGNFNYHLGKLEGRFIHQTDNGYELSPAGRRIVQTIISIADFEEVALAQTPIDLACPRCSAPTTIAHQNQRLYHCCTACEGNVYTSELHPPGILSGLMLDPTILRDRTPEEIILAQYAWKFFSFALAFEGICLMCTGRVEGSLDVCDTHGIDDGLCSTCGFSYESTGRFVCTVCNHTYLWGIIQLAVIHPAGIAFCWEHDVDLHFGTGELATLEGLFDLHRDAELTVESVDPPRVRVSLRVGDAARHLTFDHDLTVIDVSG